MRFFQQILLINLVLPLGCQSTQLSQGEHSVPNRAISIHGHRGSRGTLPENTLPAFREAIAAGADYLELDVHLSKDDVIIVSHDPDITGHLCRDPQGQIVKTPIPIRTLTAREIATYDCGNVAQARFPEQQLIPKTPLPRLEEVFQLVKKEAPRIGLNIEAKMTASVPKYIADPIDFTRRIIHLVHQYDLTNQVILQSFDLRIIEAGKRMDPKIRLSCLYEGEVTDFCTPTAKLGAGYASPDFHLVTPEKVRACHEQGILVVPWTLNDEGAWEAALRAGVDGIISDYPRKAIHFLSTHSSQHAE
jgi:glycerophosphoryl diester phosphodiesterase